MVVNGREKPGKWQVSLEEMNKTEPLYEVSKTQNRRVKSLFTEGAEKSIAGAGLLAMYPPAYRRHDF